MNDMRKLMEAVKPLFESSQGLNDLLARFEKACAVEMDCYGDVNTQMVQRSLDRGDIEGAAGEMTAAMSDRNGGEAPDEAYEMALGMLTDYMEGGGMSETSAGAIAEGNSDAEYELEEIMTQLNELSDQAKSIAQQYYPNLYSTYDAYGAFDFGSSRNSRDATFEKFVGEILEGDVEDEDY